MISLQDLKRKYVEFYSEIKNYIWPFDTVKDLADLEIAIFDRFPDMHEVRKLFQKFRSDIFQKIKEYEELEEAVNKFQEFIDDEDEVYSQLTSVTEEYSNESVEDKKSAKKPIRKESSKGRGSDRARVRTSRSSR